MTGGGAEYMTLEIIKYLLQKRYDVDLVIREFFGPLLEHIPARTNLVVVDRNYAKRKSRWQCSVPPENFYIARSTGKIKIFRHLRYLVPNWPLGMKVLPRRANRYVVYACDIADYLEDMRPKIAMSILPNDFLCLYLGLSISRIPAVLICSIRNNIYPSSLEHNRKRACQIFTKILCKADHVHTVSEGIKSAIIAGNLCPSSRVTTIYNPAKRTNIETLAEEKTNHQWVEKKVDLNLRIVLAVGNLRKAKNHKLLVNAFVGVHAKFENAKLIILGEGGERENLERQVDSLDMSDHISLPGWTANPFVYMKHCDVFVLSSDYEGFGNVLVEALLCGCNIVSTDCPHGPREILDNEKYGRLIPVYDQNAMTKAINDALNETPPVSLLQRRAESFGISKIGLQFEKLFAGALADYRSKI